MMSGEAVGQALPTRCRQAAYRVGVLTRILFSLTTEG